MRPLDWDWLMGAGLGLLRLRPADFWTMTPLELGAALKGILGDAATAMPPGRRDLTDLMARYPDSKDK